METALRIVLGGIWVESNNTRSKFCFLMNSFCMFYGTCAALRSPRFSQLVYESLPVTVPTSYLWLIRTLK